MSKRQFKAHASSSRAAAPGAGFGGFGGFGSSSTGSTLSYLFEPPNLSSISDANVIVCFKNLLKKDGTTKSKALEDLLAYVQAHPHEEGGGAEESILEAWVKFYPRLAIDNSRRVRELSHNLQYELLKSARKRMEKYISKVVGSWLAGTYDRDRAVAKAAMDGITSFLDTDEKIAMFWKRCQVQIIDYAQEAIDETPQTLSDERTMNADDVQAKYFRVVGSSISLVVNLLAKLGRDDILKHQDKYEAFISKNKRLWALASSEDAFVRRVTDQLLIVCLDKQREIIESDLELISNAFIAEALRSSQSSSAFQLLQALAKLTSQFPLAWTSSYKGKKSPLTRLRNFVEKGSQGGPSAYWQSLRSLLQLLPSGVLPTDIESSLDFLHAFRQGVSNREEPRSNAAEAWSSYFETVTLLVRNISDPSIQSKLFQESVFPVFEQYLHPVTENSKWSVGNSTAPLAKAYRICAAAKGAELRRSFSDEWHRLADDFIARIRTSLPEQSGDYHKSQTAVAAEGHRWFKLLSEVLQGGRPEDDFLIRPSTKIITTALETVVSRNGKPYSATATVEAALRLTPTLMEISPECLESVRSFIENHLPELITSPSSTYLVSILNLFRSIPSQEAVFQKVWQLTIDELLSLPDGGQKSKAISALISNNAVSSLTQGYPALQDLFLDATTRAVEGDIEAWPLFEAAITFDGLDEPTETKLLNQVLESLDASDANVDGVFKALEFITTKKPSVLRQSSSTHVTVITKLLALMEISDSTISERASKLRTAMENSDKASSTLDGRTESPMIHVIRENLETAGPQSLAIETIVQQAVSILKASADTLNAEALFPDTVTWMRTLTPVLNQIPNPALGVMRPFAGAVFLVRSTPSVPISRPSRDFNGYSIPLRMAMYTARLIGEFPELLPPSVLVDILYLLDLTAQLVNDQLDLGEENKLFASAADPDVMAELKEFVFASKSSLAHIIPNAKSWQDDFDRRMSNEPLNNSGTAGALVFKLLEASNGDTPASFYAARALSDLLQKLVNTHGWHNTEGDSWLQKLDILKASTRNILGAVALLTGLQENLGTSKIANNMCNRLISDIAGASAQSEKTLGLLVLLNASLSVYDEGDLPVAQNRLVFAVKQVLSWTDTLSANSFLLSEALHALHRLLPAIKDVYGTYWETALGFCISIWDSSDSAALSNENLPMVGMSLKLYTILRTLEEANDDLEDSLRQLSYQISQGLINLLKLGRSKENLPLIYADDLLAREVRRIPLDHIKDNLTDLYPLVASDYRMVQSAAFDLLHRALPEAQQQISVDVLLEKKDARLPEELLSLLLDAPSVRDLSDDFRVEFPTSVRGYLLSWHLVYDSYSNASYKVRNDYSDLLKSENYVGPLLDFIFDTLIYAGDPRTISGFDASMIRSYDMWQANDSESNERSLDWLLVNLYYLCLKYTPSFAKSWWVDCKSKQTRLAVEAATRNNFSPLVIEETLDEVTKWAGEQDTTEYEKELIVKISKRSREVFAGYEVDEMLMQIVIRLPENYPLEGVKVEGVNRVAVSEKKWISWLMITQGVITFSNGSITDGLNIFRKNVIGALKGQTECAICYSIISSDKKMPDKRCQTCKNLFHSSCLFKWFATSNQSTCPLCRNPFNYGTDYSRRARESAAA